VLRPLQERFRSADHPQLLVGLELSDDAAVYQLTPEVAVILTVDYFTPIVDDPYDYGAIAAANALSDVYAMGGEVTLALNVCCFPPDLPAEVVTEILKGGADKVAEAGAVIAGGHTVDDKEPKYGLAVLGLVHPKRILSKAGVRPGDVLCLTKRLGVGMVTTAAKGDVADPAHIALAVAQMKLLNRTAVRIAVRAGAHACTDVTGFSLLGHACEMAEKSRVRLRFSLQALPFLDGARQYAEAWLFPGGSCRNRDCYGPQVTFASGIAEETQLLLFTPETSGGLLVAVPHEQAEELARMCHEHGQDCWQVGEVVQGAGVEVAG
jgi:selenide,water dikinase